MKCWRECGEIGTLIYGWQEYKMLPSFWKALWQYVSRGLGIYPKKII